MQVNNKPSNIPFKVPSEVDGQNRLQTPQDIQQQASQARTLASGDKLSISSEAKALSNEQNLANDPTATARNRTQVRARTNAADVSDNNNDTSTQLRATREQTVRTNQPAAPPEQTADTNTTQPEQARNNQPATTAQAANTPSSSAPENSTPATAPLRTEQTPPPEQNTPPQAKNTAQKAAQESPVSASSGLASGPYNINLTV
ncbi:MAG: hypothetical protein V1706_01210 [Pseudomonadota bacterium]